MQKQKRQDSESALLFVLTLALLFAFASLIPLWDAQLGGLTDSFFVLFSIFFIGSAIAILQSIFKWSRATVLLVLSWLFSVGVTQLKINDMEFSPHILSGILIAIFLGEIYFNWPKAVQRFKCTRRFSEAEQERFPQTHHLEELLSDDEIDYLLLQQDTQVSGKDKAP